MSCMKDQDNPLYTNHGSILCANIHGVAVQSMDYCVHSVDKLLIQGPTVDGAALYWQFRPHGLSHRCDHEYTAVLSPDKND